MIGKCNGCNASQTKIKNGKEVCAYCGNEIIVIDAKEVVGIATNIPVKGNGNIIIQNSNSIVNINHIDTFNA